MKQPPASPSSARSPRNQLIGHPTLDLHHSHHHHLSPTSTYQLPTNSPKHTKSSAFKGLQSVFQRKLPDRSLSSNSLRSSYSASNASATDTHSLHPYATMPPAPLPVVSTNEHIDDEQECPVCLEPLSFSFRLPGEKPHVVPECGHSLHEVSPLVVVIPVHHTPAHLTIGMFYRCIWPSTSAISLRSASQIKSRRLWRL